MAGEPTHSRCRRNQDGAVRAALTSIRGTADWYHSARVPGSHTVLDGRGPGDEALGVPALLQRLSRARGVEWWNTGIGTTRERSPRAPRFVPLAGALSRAAAHADRRVRCRPAMRIER